MVHLHRHSQFSRLDGIGTSKQFADRAAELGQGALAQTDHGTLSGALHHIEACRHAGLLPISGVEAYFRPDRSSKESRTAYHLCLFAKNLRGWHNLLRIVSTAYSEIEDGGGFYQYPCVDFELLKRYNDGVICSSACVQSWLNHLIKSGDSVAAAEYVTTMQNIFGDDFWLEVQPHDFEEQRVLNIESARLSDEYGVPLIATNDAHFPFPEWAETQRIAKIMGVNKSILKVKKDVECGKADYLAELQPTLYLCSENEMRSWFSQNHPDFPYAEEAIKNTDLLVQSTNPFLLDKTMKLPKVTESIEESEWTLRSWITEALKEIPEDKQEIYRERVETEFAVLKDKGVLDYFVMVGEVVRWAKSQGIRVGLGRGSAAGCLVSYLIGITAIDPIPYGLLFERFLNPGRKGLPDIDLDFQGERRSEVKAYIAKRYGQEHVADIISHSTFKPRKVIQDLCRVYDDRVSYAESKAVTDTIEIRQDDEETTLEELVHLNSKLKAFKDKYPEIWEHALRLEGGVANASKHAAGIVITPKPIIEYMALERGKKGDLVTSWSDAADFQVISDYGFVKLDALGIKDLDKHEYACKLIEERTGEKIDLNSLPALTDPYAVDDDVMEGFRQGYTVGIFQFGGRGITNLLKEIKPDHIFDIAAANALYRPGPMKGGMHRKYAKRKHGEEPITYWHGLVKPVLQNTYGIVAYQEQVMEIAKQLGGFSAAEADDLRKAMGKLYRIAGGRAAKDYMRQFEAKWFDGTASRGLTEKVAQSIWDKILEFGHYGFNLSHSASYALQAYQGMYLKRKYPAEFYAAFLTLEEDEEKIQTALREARTMGLEILLPHINKSQVGCHVTEDGALQLGFANIKGIGWKSASKIVRNQPFTDFEDFITRAGSDADTRAIVESGVLDPIADRGFLLSMVDKVNSRSGGEWEVWEHLKHNVKLKNPRPVPDERREPSPEEVLRRQSIILNLPVSSISMNEDERVLISSRVHTIEDVEDMPKKSQVVVGGEIVKIIQKKTKKGKQYANVFLVFEDDEWTVKFWEEKLNAFGHTLEQGNLVLISGKKDEWGGNLSVVADHVALVSELKEELNAC